MYFIVNKSPQPLDKAISNFQVHRSYVVKGTGQHHM